MVGAAMTYIRTPNSEFANKTDDEIRTMMNAVKANQMALGVNMFARASLQKQIDRMQFILDRRARDEPKIR
jgi:hypothetical protein